MVFLQHDGCNGASRGSGDAPGNNLNHPDRKDRGMVIETKRGESFDTERDLTAPERHILQKLFIWESMASSVDQFRQRKREAFLKGWNSSGPIQESEAMKTIVADLEEKVIDRLGEGVNP